MNLHIFDIRDLTKEDKSFVAERLPLRFEKSMRLKSESDRLRSIAAGLLMLKYLGIESESDIRYGAQGKPYLASPGRPLHFSISHSGGLAVLVTSDCEVGVDIEEISGRALKLSDRILSGPEAERCMNCSDGELRELLDATDEDTPFAGMTSETISREARATLLWTRRECIMKAFGDGLAMYKEITDTGLTSGGITEIRDRSCKVTSYPMEGYCLSVCEIPEFPRD